MLGDGVMVMPRLNLLPWQVLNLLGQVVLHIPKMRLRHPNGTNEKSCWLNLNLISQYGYTMICME